jgi:hypothetical protein
VHSIFNGYWFWGRPSVDDLWWDLRAATRDIRPDWDLSAPGVREAWAAGDYTSFQDGTGAQPMRFGTWSAEHIPRPAIRGERRA